MEKPEMLDFFHRIRSRHQDENPIVGLMMHRIQSIDPEDHLDIIADAISMLVKEIDQLKTKVNKKKKLANGKL